MPRSPSAVSIERRGPVAIVHLDHRLVETARAIELIGEARLLRAAEALEWGILDEVVEGDVVSEAVRRAPATPKRCLADCPARVLDDVEEAAAVGGSGSGPAPLLIRLVREGRTLGDW